MYRNTDAEIRPDLQAVVMEALEAEKFFIADKIFPLLGKTTKSGEYRKIVKGSGGILDETDSDVTLRAPKTPYKEVDRTYEKAGYMCRDRGLIEVVDDSEEADLARFFQAEEVASKLTLANILRAQETRVQSVVQNPDIWGSINRKVAYTEANIDNDTLDVPYDFEEAIGTVHKRQELVNTIILARPVWKRIRRSTKLRKYIFGDMGGGKMITPKVFLEAFQDSAPITNLFIAEAVRSTAKKGEKVADNKLQYIWNNNYVWFGNVTAGEIEAGGAGRIIYWEEDAEFNYVVETYRDEPRRSDVVRVRQHNTEQVVNECAGTLLKTDFA